jgi:hypothetical protein
VKLRLLLVLGGCAAGGPHDTLDRTNHDVVVDAGARGGGDKYVARRPLVAVGLVETKGLGDDESRRVVDRLADAASACFKHSKQVAPGATRITLPIDEGGTTGAPGTAFSPPASAAIGMVCILAPLRLMTFTPGATRSITVEAAWGNDIAP